MCFPKLRHVVLAMVMALILGPALPAAEPASKTQELMKERLATARDYLRQTMQRYQNHVGTVDQAREATRLVLEAELDLCATAKDRIAILEKYVAEAVNIEKMADALVKTGQGQQGAWLAAKADRLKGQIELERAKEKAGAASSSVKVEQSAPDQVALAEAQLAIKKAALVVAEAQVVRTRAKLSTAKAQVLEAAAAQSLAEKQRKRIDELAKNGAIDVALVDEHQAKLEAARARRAQAEGVVAESQTEVALEEARLGVARAELDESALRTQQLKARVRSPE
jgi:hypothetical protein